MKLKKGVQIERNGVHLHIRVLEAMLQVSALYEKLGITGDRATVTSLLDGTHSSGSLHYEGRAFDSRTWNKDMSGQMTEQEKNVLANLIRGLLGSDFDVVVEKTHIHVELDED